MLSGRTLVVVLVFVAGCQGNDKDNGKADNGKAGAPSANAPSGPAASAPSAGSGGSNEPIIGAVALPPADAPVWKAPCTGEFVVKAGPSASPEDPHPSDFYRPGEPIKPQDLVAFEVTMKGGGNFPHCMITSTAYEVAANGDRHVLTQRDRELIPTEGTFYKSWVFKGTGQYLVEFREASSKRVLASYALTVARQ
jgi:hypothetical protein